MGSAALGDPLAGFDAFYTAFPRHEARRDAEKAWKQLRPDAALQAVILTHLQTRRWPADKKFVPLPATFLRGRRWEDAPVRMDTERPILPANRWAPTDNPHRLIPGGQGIVCPHEPMCQTDLECVRRSRPELTAVTETEW
jgi:hypothetical protein